MRKRIKIEYQDNHFESEHFERHIVDPNWEIRQIDRAIQYHKQTIKKVKSEKRKALAQKQIENLEFDKLQIIRRNNLAIAS